MDKYYYKKSKKSKLKKFLRLISIFFVITGISIISYVIFPIISWQIYSQAAFAQQDITSPIPRANIVTPVENWFPKFNPSLGSGQVQNDTPFYSISIPKINIYNAEVSTVDNNLTKHLVNYPGTGIPAKNGNAVVFGHSTLPQLFNPKDYKTIFANAYKLKNGDEIYVLVKGVKYSYKIFRTTIVDSSDSSALDQDYDNSYLTLVTCTPPGTIWKRLIVKAKLEKI